MKMDDKEAAVLATIQCLVDEERRLLGMEVLNAFESQRLANIHVELDRYWDLLRQRRALREIGRNVGEAQVRPPEVVEKYVG